MATAWPALEKGKSVLRDASATWREFCVVTTPSPWKVAERNLPNATSVVFVDSLNRDSLKDLSERIGGVSLIVGVGGGLAMDAAKYLAKVKRIKLAQVVSTSSNNACFTRTAWTFESGARVPERDVPIPTQIIVDHDLLRQAPARMNRAGAAEILCSHTALLDWQLARDAGMDVQWEEALDRSTREELAALTIKASAIGTDQVEAFVDIIDVGAKFAQNFTSHPKARFNGGSEHVLAWALEETSGRRLIHGEAVALGILLMAHIQGNNAEAAADIILSAGIRYQPEQLGITWDDVDATMSGLPRYATRVPWYTIINEFAKRGAQGARDLDDRFAAAKDFVQRLG